MQRESVQDELAALYQDWRAGLDSSKQVDGLSPPLLLSVSDDYCQAERRIVVFGQETKGWQWNRNLRKDFPKYPLDFPYEDLYSMRDFVTQPDSVDALCWGYREFGGFKEGRHWKPDFASSQSDSHKSPFWAAFRDIQKWPGAGVMWNNLAKSDFEGASVLQAPVAVAQAGSVSPANLLLSELAILKPDACIFFTGPYYDDLLKKTFPCCTIQQHDSEVTSWELARIGHPSLPIASFRTYHPRFLRQGQRWDFIEKMRAGVCSV